MRINSENVLRDVFQTGVDAASPAVQMPRLWREQILPWLDAVAPSRTGVWVYGAGKAAASMVQALEAAVAGEGKEAPQNRLNGFVITRQGYGLPTRSVQVREASHPVPDERGQRAAQDMLQAMAEVPAGEPVIALISGGGSSLLTTPEVGISFEDVRQLNRALLSAGTPISEINSVRKHVCSSLGGKMARACKSPIFQVIVSDVPGDDPATVASGPFSADASTFGDALAVLERWGVEVPSSVLRFLQDGQAGLNAETPKPGDAVFERVQTCIMASAATMLDAVARRLEAHGYAVMSLGDELEAESRDVAAVQATMVKQVCRGAAQWPKAPVAIVSGGECSVTLPVQALGGNKGGRNTEFLLALVCQLKGFECGLPIAAMAADTDGTDGLGEQAGAFMLPGDEAKAQAMSLNARQYLDRHATADYFEAIGRLLLTGPTQTNVNDMRVILIGEPQS